MTDSRNVQAKGMEVYFNRTVGFLARRGLSLFGSRLLAVRGRTSGEWRTTPVNLLTIDGERYLVAPRGHTQWVRNMRVAGGGELRLGRRAEPFTATELSDADKIPALRRYLKRWGWEVGRFFDRPIKNLDDAGLAELAPLVPVFRIR
ncbi:nitroreductase/quinone reductase family protein [Actinomadura rayongensis]|uniref:Nitroreductase family deazaflavin-dependent oxidoreductase n=1 Tax=Actinomadura rayongensis TaxID=1429076 RepID=A0A6I4W3A4_9ACTN|nr:nitroreductase/quinone reductase family protein [Actinomadura rayongensis]MXQ65159.1 nitroreductase family deazaflavin-dependent oxidoreductase [Actinomadura rayongensis]